MKKLLLFLSAAFILTMGAWAQGAPASGVVVNSNGAVVVTITYIDSLAGTSNTMMVTTDVNGSFSAMIPFVQNPSGISLFAYACITNCNGQTVCDVSSWVPGTMMTFELNFCGGILADADGDGFDSSVDCDDNNAWAYPGAVESCNDWIDNNCNGLIDEGCNGDSTLVDADGDGYPAFADCNDNNPWVNPGAVEECGNGIDNNCDGTIDEGCGGSSDCAANIILMTDSMLNGAGNAYEVWVINATDPTGNTFMWTTGDGNTLTGAFPTYTYGALGTYTLCVFVTNAAGCMDSACVTFTVNPDGTVSPGGALQQTFTLNVSSAGPVGVEEMVIENELNAYPNPTQDLATITWNASRKERGTCFVYGMNGQLLSSFQYQGVAGKNQYSLNTSDWSAGLYQIVMVSENGAKRSVQVAK